MLTVAAQRVESLFCVSEGPSSSLGEDTFFSFLISLRHFVLGSSNSLRTFIFRSTVQYNQNEPQHRHSRWRPSIESRVRSLSRVPFSFFFLFLLRFPCCLMFEEYPSVLCFFRATRNSLLTSPTPKSKMAGDTRARKVRFGLLLPVWVTWAKCCSLIGYVSG